MTKLYYLTGNRTLLEKNKLFLYVECIFELNKCINPKSVTKLVPKDQCLANVN
jgi:hypothetical protein